MAPSQLAPTEALTKLAQWLPPRNPDADYWWNFTALTLANMLQAGGLNAEDQMEALVFHYHWMVPSLGSSPTSDQAWGAKWIREFGDRNSPVEYSWRWNSSATDRPDVRIALEPMSPFTGTALDPLNQQATIELLHRIAAAAPATGIDLAWTNHFLATLFDHDRSKYAQEAAAGVDIRMTIGVAAQWTRSGLGFKTYLLPRKLGQTGPLLLPVTLWDQAIAQLDPGAEWPAREAIMEFLHNPPAGQQFVPILLSVDNTAPTKARLKLYLHSPESSFASIRTVLTLAGQNPIPESGLLALRTLLCAITGLDPEAYTDDSDLPVTRIFPTTTEQVLPSLTKGAFYQVDIAPGRRRLDIKVAIHMRAYGVGDDWEVAEAITGWMETQGRGQYCAGYLDLIKRLTPDRATRHGMTIQTFVSIMVTESGELDVNSYFTPEAAE
ncbi:aromatic prenyltransferase [Aspergillus karnatakaensis]|uniref:aromatic prenyltransferase n=1 Tax=Aspergillus karnatakaensis TaxID=1810916 RepID=UPI003CCE22A1